MKLMICYIVQVASIKSTIDMQLVGRYAVDRFIVLHIVCFKMISKSMDHFAELLYLVNNGSNFSKHSKDHSMSQLVGVINVLS
jgi:hypothetical protein